MIAFRPFRRGDAFAVAGRDADVAAAARLETCAAEAVEAFTMRIDGAVAAVGGVSELWPGVAELWSFRAVALAPAAGFAFARFCRRIASGVAARRLQATARIDDETAIRFLHFLGLSAEARLVAFDPDGTDHLLCARIAPAGGF